MKDNTPQAMKNNHIPLNGKDDDFINFWNEMIDELSKPTKLITIQDLWENMNIQPKGREALEQACKNYIKEQPKESNRKFRGFRIKH
jgi:hypothetical protein